MSCTTFLVASRSLLITLNSPSMSPMMALIYTTGAMSKEGMGTARVTLATCTPTIVLRRVHLAVPH